MIKLKINQTLSRSGEYFCKWDIDAAISSILISIVYEIYGYTVSALLVSPSVSSWRRLLCRLWPCVRWDLEVRGARRACPERCARGPSNPGIFPKAGMQTPNQTPSAPFPRFLCLLTTPLFNRISQATPPLHLFG